MNVELIEEIWVWNQIKKNTWVIAGVSMWEVVSAELETESYYVYMIEDLSEFVNSI